MRIERKIEIEVTPFLIKNVKNASKAESIGNMVAEFGEEFGGDIQIVEHRICDEGVLILVHGNIGNALDQLMMNIAGVKKSKNEPYFEAVERARKLVRTVPDDEATEIMAHNFLRFSELTPELTNIYLNTYGNPSIPVFVSSIQDCRSVEDANAAHSDVTLDKSLSPGGM